MIESKKIDKINKGLFLLALFCIIVRRHIIIFIDKDVQIGAVNSLLLYGALGLFLLQFLINKQRSKKGIYFLGASIILFLFNRDGAVLALVLMALAMEHIDTRFMVKSFFSMHVILFVLGMLISMILPDIAHRPEMHYRIVDGYNSVRYSFGTGNPNSVFLALLPVYTGYIYLRFEKYNIWDRLFIIASMLVVYSGTNSRTGLISIAAGLLVVEILRKVDLKNSKVMRFLVTYSPLIITLISVLSALFLHKNKIAIKLLSSRTMYWHMYIKEYGSLFNLFGNSYSPEFKAVNPADNSYIYIIAILGMVTMVLLLLVACKGLYEYSKRDMKKNIVAVLVFFVFAFGENMLIDPALNFALVILIKDVVLFNSETVNLYTYYKDMPKDIVNFIKNIGSYSKGMCNNCKVSINNFKDRRKV